MNKQTNVWNAQERQSASVFALSLLYPALLNALKKLSPQRQWRNPVMFVVWLGSVLTSLISLDAWLAESLAAARFSAAVALWLWFTVLFANFAEALAEGRGRAQAEALRGTRQHILAKKLAEPKRDAQVQHVAASTLRKGDIVWVDSGDFIPADGEVISGLASVDESAMTGESAPVIRASGGDSSAVTGGTRVCSDWLMIRVTTNQGEAFLDRMIAMVENAKRQKTPNEIALSILLLALTLIFLFVCASLLPFSLYSVSSVSNVDTTTAAAPISLTVLIALLVCLIPTTIGALLSAIGVAGMSRMMQAKVIATSGRAIEAAGDVDILLLDKTGTITLGNRQASAFWPSSNRASKALAVSAQLASWADETPEGRSIVALSKQLFELAEPDLEGAVFVPFSAQTRMSGVDLGARKIRKGAADAMREYLESLGGSWPQQVSELVEQVARRGSTPLVVADGHHVLGVVELKDMVKAGIKERFAELRNMGIKTVMLTGDNHLTAAAIAAESGVDDFLAEAKPEDKLRLIRQYQAAGRLVAMTGDGTNDAPALAQADVAVAMNTGTQAAKEAGNLVDLDSNPTKLIEIVAIGKQMLVTRGALTTFSLANDVAKYFAIIPAAFASTYPQLKMLDVMQLNTPNSAMLSAVIFNALIIIFLLPLALRGVPYQALGAAELLRKNLLIYGLGGLLLPFVGIKLIDVVLGLLF
ncbi:MAG: potassium-transporting ATPase subunit KdpB [Pseudomonadota bacterium]